MVPKAWGPQFHVQSGSVARNRVAPDAISFNSRAHYAILMLTPQPERVMALNSDRRHVFSAPVGTLELIPANAELFAEWRYPKENFLFALSPEHLQKLAILELGDDHIDFAFPAPGRVDLEAVRLARFLEAEFRRIYDGSVNEIYLDSLLTLFSIHLLRRYSLRNAKPFQVKRGGLSASVVGRVEEYIRANLANKIVITDLAAIANFSPSHFSRAFRETIGQSPYQYITTLRLHLVKDLACNGSLSFGDIANKAGFSTPSQMTAIMKRYWGVLPRDIRRTKKFDLFKTVKEL